MAATQPATARALLTETMTPTAASLCLLLEALGVSLLEGHGYFHSQAAPACSWVVWSLKVFGINTTNSCSTTTQASSAGPKMGSTTHDSWLEHPEELTEFLIDGQITLGLPRCHNIWQSSVQCLVSPLEARWVNGQEADAVLFCHCLQSTCRRGSGTWYNRELKPLEGWTTRDGHVLEVGLRSLQPQPGWLMLVPTLSSSRC